MELKINEVAKLTGVTIRTLHYYDQIGLLKPYEITKSGYRIYNKESLETLQQILLFRELDFPLNQIKDIMTNPSYDKNEALKNHKKLLIKKRKRLDTLIDLVNQTIEGGELEMSFKEFDITEIEYAKKQYAKEVKERFGHTKAYEESQEKTSQYDKQKWKSINDESVSILQKFAEIKNSDPASDKAQQLVKQWQTYITKNFYHCTKEILSGLGIMYVEDERFTQNIDKYGEGTAKFMAASIKIFCK